MPSYRKLSDINCSMVNRDDFCSYNISIERIILGDLKNIQILNFLILSAKKVIYNAKIPQKQQMVIEIIQIFSSEKCKAQIIYIYINMYTNRIFAGIRRTLLHEFLHSYTYIHTYIHYIHIYSHKNIIALRSGADPGIYHGGGQVGSGVPQILPPPPPWKMSPPPPRPGNFLGFPGNCPPPPAEGIFPRKIWPPGGGEYFL